MALSQATYMLANGLEWLESTGFGLSLTFMDRVRLFAIARQDVLILLCMLPAMSFYFNLVWRFFMGTLCVGAWLRKQYYQHRRVKVPVAPIEEVDGNKFESLMPGSSFMTQDKIPKSQVFLFTLDGDVMGSGIRYLNYLVTPRHVVMDKQQALMSKTVTGGRKLVDLTKQTQIEEDLLMIDIGDSIFSMLGVSNSRFCALESPQTVSITGAFLTNNSAIGVLQNADCFGIVHFGGSTIRGFSGAPYMAGPHVMGIHTNGAKASQPNHGYSGSYVQCLIDVELGSPIKESWTEDEDEPIEKDTMFATRKGKRLMRRKGKYSWINDSDYDQVMRRKELPRYRDTYNQEQPTKPKIVPVEDRPVNPSRKGRSWTEMMEEEGDAWEKALDSIPITQYEEMKLEIVRLRSMVKAMQEQREREQFEQAKADSLKESTDHFLVNGGSAVQSTHSRAALNSSRDMSTSNAILKKSEKIATVTNGSVNTLSRSARRNQKRKEMVKQARVLLNGERNNVVSNSRQQTGQPTQQLPKRNMSSSTTTSNVRTAEQSIPSQ